MTADEKIELLVGALRSARAEMSVLLPFLNDPHKKGHEAAVKGIDEVLNITQTLTDLLREDEGGTHHQKARQ